LRKGLVVPHGVLTAAKRVEFVSSKLLHIIMVRCVCVLLCESVKSIDIILHFPYNIIFLLYDVFTLKYIGVILI